MSAHRPGPTLVGAISGALVGIGVGALLIATGVLRLPAADDPEAPGRFLVAWQRYRMATFSVDAEVTRRRSDGSTLRTARLEVQQPPNRVVQEHGSVSGRLEGRAVNCSLSSDGSQICGADGPVVPPWEDEVTEELAVLRGYVAGDDRIYDVRQDGWCFELTLAKVFADPPYGERARFCFDEATGALVTLDRQLDGDVTEVVQATAVSGSVSPLELTATIDAATSPVVEGPAGASVTPTDEPAPDAGGTPGTTDSGTTDSGTTDSGTTDDPLAAELAGLDEDAFFARVREAISPEDFRAIVTESMRRLEAGELSINDPRWLDARGQPLPAAPPLVRAMLEAGFHAPTPGG